MRRTFVVLAAATALAVGGGVATADSADARRNLGGTVPEGALCVRPGGVVLGDQASSAVPCVCISVAGVGTSLNVGRGGACPQGVDRPKIDRRNLGG